MTEPSKEQLASALDQVKEQQHAIMFLYKTDKQRCGKLLEELDNNVLHKKAFCEEWVYDIF